MHHRSSTLDAQSVYTKLCVTVVPVNLAVGAVPVRILVHDTEPGEFRVRSELDEQTHNLVDVPFEDTRLSKAYASYIERINKLPGPRIGGKQSADDYENVPVIAYVTLSTHDARGNELRKCRFERKCLFRVKELMRPRKVA